MRVVQSNGESKSVELKPGEAAIIIGEGDRGFFANGNPGFKLTVPAFRVGNTQVVNGQINLHIAKGGSGSVVVE